MAGQTFVQSAVDKLRSKLLDLSGRNSLISFRHSDRSRRQVRIVDLTPDTAFQMLEDGKSIEIAALPLPTSEPEDEQTSGFAAALDAAKQQDAEYLATMKELGDNPPVKPALRAEAALRDRVRAALGMPPVVRDQLVSREEQAKELGINPSTELPTGPTRRRRRGQARILQTLLYPEELERKLSGVFEQARLSESETGINTLFAAFGFLEWYENESSAEPIFSPILLYPLVISREIKDGKYVYSVASRGEDVSVNICLQERLKRDFGIQPIELCEDETPEQYLARLTDAVSDQRAWKLRHNLTIGFFSFAKLAMFHDLNPVGLAGISDEAVLSRLILGDEKAEPSFAEDYEVDEPALQEKLRAMIHDADSSQLSAVVDVLDGKDLVIEGPPGTGKSQTITNIIAAALAEGKSVLFIAEKRAALEVVKKRLDEAGLGTFCLELHSNKTRKTDVLKSLEQRLQERRTVARTGVLDSLLGDQQSIRTALGEYISALNTTFGELGKTLHDISWRYLRLRREYPDMPPKLSSVSVERCEQMTQAALESKLSILRTLERHLAANLADHPRVVTHPWYGLANPLHTPAECETLVQVCKRAVGRLDALSRAAAQMKVIGSEFSAASLQEIQAALRRVNATTELLDLKPLPDLIERCADDAALTVILRSLQSTKDLWSVTERLSGISGGRPTDALSAEEIADVASRAATVGFSGLRIEEFDLAADRVRRDLEALQEVVDFCESLRTRAGLAAGLTVGYSTLLFTSVDLLKNAQQVLKHRRDDVLLEDNAETLSKIGRVAEELREKRESLSAVLVLERLTASSELDRSAETLRRSNFWSYFKREYWAARRAYFEVARSKERCAVTVMAERLESCARFLDAKAAFEAAAEYRTLLGPLYAGIDSDPEPLVNTNRWAADVRKALPGFDDLALKLRQVLFTAPSQQLEALGSMSGHPRFKIVRDALEALAEAPAKNLSAILQKAQEKDAAVVELLERTRKLDLPVPTSIASFGEIEKLLRKRDDLLSEAKKADAVCKEALGKHHPITRENIEAIQRTQGYVDSVRAADIPDTLRCALLKATAQQPLREVLSDLPRLEEAASAAALELRQLDEMRPIELGDDGPETRAALEASSTQPVPALRARIAAALEQSEGLPALVDYLKTEETAVHQGLKPILALYRDGKCSPKNLDVAFEIALYGSLLKRASAKYPSFGKSVGFEFDELRSRFRRTDEQILDLYRKNLRSTLLSTPIREGVSAGRASELTERGLIQHEVAKERKHLPIRQLLARAGTAIKQMKPCFMMSPLSVAQFLKQDFTFDLVVMDEASQLRPEEALGAILRGKQAVVVGDPKQLPPTNFFNFTDNVALAEDEDPDLEFDQESIMELALRALRARRLKWHYRSKHESLIAFSNHHFYDRDLIVFPSPHHRNEAFGIRYEAIDGVYDKSRNIKEAQATVDAAVEFMGKRPDRSLGIVAMNQPQRDLIAEMLDDRARHDAVVQDYMAKWEKTLEPLFVKNLENVQGDERDVIFISTVYGSDAGGHFHQRFGPINGAMGHRRLNVLFTRAKYQMTIFTSLQPDRISVDNKSSAGLRALKQFLTYAKTGRLESIPNLDPTREPDSEFEIFVMRELRDRGYKVVPQVGVAGYWIDLAVQDPKMPGRFILGIECDGATYHSAKSARDRDKTRQEVLEDLGWEIHRIWSTDWFQHTQRELKRLLAALPPPVAA